MPTGNEKPRRNRRRRSPKNPAEPAPQAPTPTAILSRDHTKDDTQQGPSETQLSQPSSAQPQTGSPKQRAVDATNPSRRNTRGVGKPIKKKPQQDAEILRPQRNQKLRAQSGAAESSDSQVQSQPDASTSKQPLTANKFIETPQKLYAGPTFHASPAASTIPMPKLFSRSVPNVDKTISLTSMLDQTVNDSSSNGDDSPSKGATPPDPRALTREESPLDLLFRADREAKARKPDTRPTTLDPNRQVSSPGHLEIPNGTPTKSSGPRNHIRHHTDGSNGGMFPLEMDERARSTQPHQNWLKTTTVNDRQDKPEDVDDPYYEKSMALKKLLNFSGTETQSNKADVDKAKPQANPATPSPKPRSQQRSSARLSGTPPLFPNGLEGTSAEERRAALLALTERQISMPAQTPSQRPPSSSLRKEVKMPDSPLGAQDHPPLTPTGPTRYGKPTLISQGGRAPATTGHIATVPQMHSGNIHTNTGTSVNDRDPLMKSMEDDLRRLLKIDVRNSDGVNGVQS